MRQSRKRDREDLWGIAMDWIPGVSRCRECKGLHASGYVCPCGHDGPDTEIEWPEVEDLLRRAR